MNIINIIFVKRGHAYLENYTEDLLSKKERKEKKKKKKKKKKTFNGREVHMYRPPWLVHETILYSISSVLHHKKINNTINGIFCHRLQYGKGTYGTIAYIIVIGKQCNLFISVI